MVATLKSCSRQVWYGAREDFQSFPDNSSGSHTPLLQGKEAYSFLLRLVLGLDSKVKGETNIAGQFYGGWKKFEQDHPEKAKQLAYLVPNLKTDSRIISKTVCAGLRSTNISIIAKNLVGLKRDERVLVVPHTRRKKSVLNEFDKFMRALSLRNSRPSVVVLAYRSKEEKQILAQAIHTLQARSIIEFKMELVPIEEIPRQIESADRVFLNRPMGDSESFDASFVNIWQNRVRRDNRLVHMCGDKVQKGRMNDFWHQFGLDNFVGPDDIGQERERRLSRNDEVFQVAEIAVEKCVSLRNKGGCVSSAVLKRALGSELLGVATLQPR